VADEDNIEVVPRGTRAELAALREALEWAAQELEAEGLSAGIARKALQGGEEELRRG
jgi:hypothetical protein